MHVELEIVSVAVRIKLFKFVTESSTFHSYSESKIEQLNKSYQQEN